MLAVGDTQRTQLGCDAPRWPLGSAMSANAMPCVRRRTLYAAAAQCGFGSEAVLLINFDIAVPSGDVGELVSQVLIERE